MKKKVLLVLLVVLMVGILAFSVFACQPKDSGKNNGGTNNNNNGGNTGDNGGDGEKEISVEAGDMLDDLIGSIDETIKVVNTIKTEASVNAELYVDVTLDGKANNIKLSVAGSVDKDTNANNWALVQANVLGVEVALFAQQDSAGNEYLYFAQNVLNEKVKWSKLSQAESANLISGVPAEEFTDANENGVYDAGEAFVDANENEVYDGKKFGVVPALLDLIAGLEDAKFQKAEEFTDANKNGQWDGAEAFTDANGNKKWDEGEEYVDANGNKKYDEAEKYVDANGNKKYDTASMFGDGADVSDVIDEGLVGSIGIVGTIQGLGGLVGGLLFAPVEDNVIDTDKKGNQSTNLSIEEGDHSYGAALNIAGLTDLLSNEAIADLVSGLGDLSEYQGIADVAVPLLLGGNLNLSTFTFTPNKDKEGNLLIPDIRLYVDVNEDDTFGGVHLSYATADESVKVAFGLDNISFTAESAAAPAAVKNAVAGAEEFALNIGLDIEAEVIKGGYANLDLNVYPNVSILGFGADGYLDIDFSNLYAEAVLTYDAEVGWDWDSNTAITEPTEVVIAQYNADKLGNLYFDFSTVADMFGMSDRTYMLPLNLQEMYDSWAAPTAEVEVSNAGVADTVIGIVSTIINDKDADILGIIMDDVLGGTLLTDLLAEVEALAKFATISEEGVATLDLEGIINALIAKDGLIGESKEKIYYEEGKYIVLGEIAEDIATDKVLGTIAGLAGVTEDEIVALVAAFTGATLDKTDAYANMSISATGYAQDGIGATISAVLGKDDDTAEIKIGLNASIIDPEVEIEDKLSGNYEEVIFYDIVDGEFVPFSTNVSKDGGKLLLEGLKKIFNSISGTVDEKFTIATANTMYVTMVTEADTTAQQWVNYGFVDSMRFFVDASVGSTVTVSNVKNAEAAAQWIVNTQFGPMPQMDVAQLFAENNDAISFEVVGEGIMITVYAPAGEACVVSFTVEEPASEEPEVPAGPAATALVLNTEITTPNFVYGPTSTQNIYLYTYTAEADCTLTFSSDYADAWFSIPEVDFFGNTNGGEPLTDNQISLTAGQTVTIAVADWAYGTAGITFTATIA